MHAYSLGMEGKMGDYGIRERDVQNLLYGGKETCTQGPGGERK